MPIFVLNYFVVFTLESKKYIYFFTPQTGYHLMKTTSNVPFIKKKFLNNFWELFKEDKLKTEIPIFNLPSQNSLNLIVI